MSTQDASRPLIISYLTLRRAVGFIGIFLPVVLVIGQLLINGEDVFQSSISNYYYTNMGDVFVGAMCAVALFLFTYKGYDQWDAWSSKFAGICAIGVAMFPTSIDQPVDPENIHYAVEGSGTSNWHLLFAALFFLTLAGISLFLFTKSSGVKTPEKKMRNRVYRTCGVVMVLCLAIIFVYTKTTWLDGIENYHPVFIFETLALWAFGMSWIIKGEFLLKDKA